MGTLLVISTWAIAHQIWPKTGLHPSMTFIQSVPDMQIMHESILKEVMCNTDDHLEWSCTLWLLNPHLPNQQWYRGWRDNSQVQYEELTRPGRIHCSFSKPSSEAHIRIANPHTNEFNVFRRPRSQLAIISYQQPAFKNHIVFKAERWRLEDFRMSWAPISIAADWPRNHT